MIGKVISGVLCALCLCTVGVAQTAYESTRDSLVAVELDSANGRPVTSRDDLTRAIEPLTPGAVAAVVADRRGTRITSDLIVGATHKK